MCMDSTAYVAGEQVGLIPEKPFLMGETLKKDTYLDIESELSLIKETMGGLKVNCSTEKDERKTMKELGLKRSDTINIIMHVRESSSTHEQWKKYFDQTTNMEWTQFLCQT